MDALPAVLGLIGFWYVVVPLLVWNGLRADAVKRMEPFDPSRHFASPQVVAFLRDNIAALADQQFRQVADLMNAGGKTTMRIVLLLHPDGAVATIAVVSNQQGSALPVVEFTAELDGGTVLDVSNVRTPPVFAPQAWHVTYRFPEVRDPVRLYRVFQAMLQRRFGSRSMAQRDVASDPARFLAQAMDKECRGQVAAGYHRLNERTGGYEPTLKGAYLMTWKLQFPFKQIRAERLRSKARQLLRELGMEGPDQRPVDAPDTLPLEGRFEQR